jgi:hypothetical protein
VIISLLIITSSCNSSKNLAGEISEKYRIKYSEKSSYLKGIKRNREKIIFDFFNKYPLNEETLYIIDEVYNSWDQKTKMKTYFFQNGKIIESYSINENSKKLKIRRNEYWGLENFIPTLKLIVNNAKKKKYEELNEIHNNEKYQLEDYWGTFYLTEISVKGKILHIQKFEGFMVPKE